MPLSIAFIQSSLIVIEDGLHDIIQAFNAGDLTGLELDLLLGKIRTLSDNLTKGQ